MPCNCVFDYAAVCTGLKKLLVGDGLLCLLVEEMNLFDIESKLDGIADLRLGSGIDTGCERRVVNIKIQEDFSAQKLTDIDLALENRSALFRNGLLVQIRDMLGTNADGNGLAIIAAVNDRLCLCGCQRNVNACNRNACLVSCSP